MASSCIISKKIDGRYIHSTKPTTDNQELILNQNGTFIYRLFYDVGGAFTFRGKWKKNGSMLILEESPLQRKIESDSGFLIETKTDSKSKDLVVYDIKDSTVVAGAEVEINESGVWTATDATGSYKFSDIDIKNIRVRFFSFSDATFRVQDKNANHFAAYMSIKEKDQWLKSPPTLMWLVKNNRLVGLDKNGKPETGNVLTKQ